MSEGRLLATRILLTPLVCAADPATTTGPAAAPEPPVGRTEADRRRNAALLAEYEYGRYPAAITGYNGQDRQRIGFVRWQDAVRARVGARGSYKAGMAQLSDGRLVLAACRDNNAPEPARRGFLVDVYASADLGLTWEKINRTRLFGKEPSMTALADGSLVLTTQDFGPGSSGDRMPVCRSADGGRNWQTILLPGRAYPRNVIVEADGNLLMIRGGKGMASPHLHLCRSRDGGATWDVTEGVIDWDAPPYSEVASIRLADGRLLAALRTLAPDVPVPDAHGFGVTMVTESKDDGAHWATPRTVTNIAEVHAFFTALDDGRILLTYANYHLPFGVFAIVSSDGGRTWDRDHPVQLALSASNTAGWPVTLQLADHSLITAYALTAYLHQSPGAFVTEVVRWRLP